MRHPVWGVHPAREAHIDLDWGAVYRAEWAMKQGAEPVSTVVAVGSPVAVYPSFRFNAIQSTFGRMKTRVYFPSDPEASLSSPATRSRSGSRSSPSPGP